MGRKSAKGKEKKLKRKEEQASLAASQAVVDAANALDDPMESLAPFKKYNRNGLNLTIDCCRSTSLDEQTLDWAFNLTKKNMQTLYEASKSGWRSREKRDEMTDDRAWYLIARETDDTPVGLIHFRFDMDFDDEVVYCYEIQLVESVRRKGLGKFLMQILSLLAHKVHMKKVMLTVFKKNFTAFEFFKNTLKFEIDETSPSIFDPLEEDEYDYEIMSKAVPQKKVPQPRQVCRDRCCTQAVH
ncbi:N-alpha-acetyltransferase 40-like [Patiria miniata]|uniref:N-alpha-acetyltransferase 40 n=1 Tax=Patiria miniata TaxID=46514 RepID=A0A914BDI8_PATMI|nr:N-alpha-acetyltransferase 40-like [Patiria miniata]